MCYSGYVLLEERKNMLLLIAIIVGSVVLDQLTKWLAVVYLQGEPSFPLWKDVLHFTYAENKGMAFSLFSGENERWIFMLFSTVAILGILVYLIFWRPESKWMQVSLAMIAGGGIGNMIDRVLLGYVVDFIDFTLIDFAIFNVADSFVCVGAGILIVCLVLDLKKEIEAERAAKLSKTQASEEKRSGESTDEN
jgi:signal peptidase II